MLRVPLCAYTEIDAAKNIRVKRSLRFISPGKHSILAQKCARSEDRGQRSNDMASLTIATLGAMSVEPCVRRHGAENGSWISSAPIQTFASMVSLIAYRFSVYLCPVARRRTSCRFFRPARRFHAPTYVPTRRFRPGWRIPHRQDTRVRPATIHKELPRNT